MKLKSLMVAAFGSVIMLNAAERPALPEFDASDVLADFTAEELVNKYSHVVEDAEAVTGKALIRNAPDFTKNEGIAFRVFNKTTKEYDPVNAVIPPEAVPTDGKFHWYNLGNLKKPLTKDYVLYMHKGGYGPTKEFSDVNVPAEIFGTPAAIWISLKLSGPVYTSQKDVPSRYAIDRVVIVKGSPLKKAPQTYPIPAELKDKKICFELSGTALNMFEKSVDNESVVRCALPSKQELSIGMYGVGTQKNRLYKGKFADDGKYHLYKIGPLYLTPGAKLSVGSCTLFVGNYYDEMNALKTYEIWVSARNEGANQAKVDRIFFVEPGN